MDRRLARTIERTRRRRAGFARLYPCTTAMFLAGSAAWEHAKGHRELAVEIFERAVAHARGRELFGELQDVETMRQRTLGLAGAPARHTA